MKVIYPLILSQGFVADVHGQRSHNWPFKCERPTFAIFLAAALGTGGTQSFRPPGILRTGGTQSCEPPRYPGDWRDSVL